MRPSREIDVAGEPNPKRTVGKEKAHRRERISERPEPLLLGARDVMSDLRRQPHARRVDEDPSENPAKAGCGEAITRARPPGLEEFPVRANRPVPCGRITRRRLPQRARAPSNRSVPPSADHRPRNPLERPSMRSAAFPGSVSRTSIGGSRTPRETRASQFRAPERARAFRPKNPASTRFVQSTRNKKPRFPGLARIARSPQRPGDPGSAG